MRDPQKHQTGLKRMKEVNGKMADMMMAKVGAASPDFADYMAEYVFGDIYARPGLDDKTRQLAAVSALLALGHAPSQLKMHMNGALNQGWSRQEIIELLIHLSVFVGIPAAMNGLFAAKELFDQRDEQGIAN